MNINIRQKTVALAGMVAMVLAAGTAWGQGAVANAAANYPSKPVQVVIPFPAGGPNEMEVRLYLPYLQESLGQPFVIDLKPGAGGMIGAQHVVRAAPDGHTLLVASSSLTTGAAINKKLPFDVTRDLAPVTVMTKRTLLLISHPALPVKNAAEYIALVRQRPGQINFGSIGNGSSFHLAGAWLHNATRTSVTFIQFKGVAQVNPEIVAGRLDATFVLPIIGLPLIKSGKVRPLGVAAGTRLKLFPDLPTLAEQGVPDYDYSSWLGFVAPAKTPRAIIDKLHGEFAKVARVPELVQKMEQEGSQLVGSPPEEAARLISREMATWNRVIQEAGIQSDE